MENNEILMKVLEKLDIMQEDISGLKQGQSRMEARLDTLEKGQANLEKSQINLEKSQANLEKGQANLEKGQANLEKWQMRTDITLDRLDQGQAAIKSQVSENTQILRGLEEASRVHRAHLDNLTIDTAHIKGNIIASGREVKLIKQNMCDVEIRTARNWMDIAKLKKVKEN